MFRFSRRSSLSANTLGVDIMEDTTNKGAPTSKGDTLARRLAFMSVIISLFALMNSFCANTGYYENIRHARSFPLLPKIQIESVDLESLKTFLSPFAYGIVCKYGNISSDPEKFISRPYGLDISLVNIPSEDFAVGFERGQVNLFIHWFFPSSHASEWGSEKQQNNMFHRIPDIGNDLRAMQNTKLSLFAQFDTRFPDLLLKDFSPTPYLTQAVEVSFSVKPSYWYYYALPKHGIDEPSAYQNGAELDNTVRNKFYFCTFVLGLQVKLINSRGQIVFTTDACNYDYYCVRCDIFTNIDMYSIKPSGHFVDKYLMH